MRLRLQDLGSRGVELELPEHEGNARVVRLDYLTDVSGLLEASAGDYRLRPVSARELVVSGGGWSFGFGTVAVDTPAVLGEVELDFTAGASGFDGTLSFSMVHAESLAFDFHGPRVSGDLRVGRLSVEHARGKGGQATGDTLAVRNLQFSIGDLFLKAASLKGRGVRVRWGSGSWAVEADRVELEDVSLAIESLGVEIFLTRVEVPTRLSVRRDDVRLGEISVREGRLTIEEVSELRGDGGGPGLDVDLRLLDRLNGRLDVDLTLDATVPLIGRRKATHHFRVPISDGTINYRQLERDLAALEDAVIDFAVRGESLVLERDVPIIPGLNKPILIWDLSEVELALAKQRLVRLRTLPGYRLPPRDPEVKKSRFSLRRVHFRNLDAALSLSAPGKAATLEGSVPHAALDALTLRGEVHHHVEREVAPTELRAGGRGFSLSLAALPVAGWALSTGALELESLEEAALSFHGPRPRRLTAALRNLSARSVDLTRGPKSGVSS